VTETGKNLLIDLGAVVGLSLFYLNDKRARDSDLERIARSGMCVYVVLHVYMYTHTHAHTHAHTHIHTHTHTHTHIC